MGLNRERYGQRRLYARMCINATGGRAMRSSWLVVIALVVLIACQSRGQGGPDPTLLAKAKGGDPVAEKDLAEFYNRQSPRDVAQAVYWFRQAATKGNPEAQSMLGLWYEFGIEVPQDIPVAISWYRKAADQGYKDAVFALGSFYERGKGVPRDPVQAILWFGKAAAQGDAGAQFNLAADYRTGEGVPQDDYQATLWFRKAAEQGMALAETELGWAYRDGRGVPQGYVEAAQWFRKSADQGEAKAQISLGYAYQKGEGVLQDYSLAYFWLDVGLAGSVDDMRTTAEAARADTAKHLTSEALTSMQTQASRWFEQHPPKVSYP
jgi:TPR repeat protein